MIQIPMRDQNSFVIEAGLEDATFFLRFDWNSEAGIWTMGIANARNEDVIRGLALVPNTPLLQQFRHLTLPAGEFVVYTDDENIMIGRTSFLNGTATLYYLTETEVAAL